MADTGKGSDKRMILESQNKTSQHTEQCDIWAEILECNQIAVDFNCAFVCSRQKGGWRLMIPTTSTNQNQPGLPEVEVLL